MDLIGEDTIGEGDGLARLRRRRLGSLACGLILTAGSLLLPPGLADVQAGDGSYDGELGGRRGKDRRGLSHRQRGGRGRKEKRHHGRRRDKDLSVPGVSLSLHNFRAQALSVRAWGLADTEVISYEIRKDWQPLAAKPASGPEYSLDFAEDGLQLIAELNTGHIIQAGSRPIGLPWITVGTGGWSKDGWQPMGATLIDASLGVGDTANAPGFQSQRVDDAADHRQFFVYIVP